MSNATNAVDNRKSRVFMVEAPRQDFDLTKARSFGNVVTLFETTRGKVFDVEQYARLLLGHLEAQQYDSKSDYLVMTGGLLPVGIALAVLTARFRQVKLLVWNTTRGEYVPKQFDIDAVLQTWNTPDATNVQSAAT